MTCDSSTENQGVNVVCTFVSVHSLQVGQVANDVILVDDSIATEHITSVSRNCECLTTVVSLHYGDHLGS